jgi:predicted RNA-binding Zn ribbon-like protein
MNDRIRRVIAESARLPTDVDELAGRFSQLSGHAVLDLMNTVDWRLDPTRSIERLRTMEDVLDWCRLTGLIAAEEHAALLAAAARHPRVAMREREAVVAWRELAYDAIVDRSGTAMREIVDAYRDVLLRSDLRTTAESGPWSWADTHVDLPAARDRIVRATVDLATRADLQLIHQCEDDACGWVYLDTSPRHNRRWCSAAGCGNRNRARRFNQRRRTETDTDDDKTSQRRSRMEQA